MTRYRIIIPDWNPCRINTLLSTHYMRRSRLKRIDADLIAGYGHYTPKATVKRRVRITVTITGRGREPDPDSFLKSTLDGLVKAKLLVDDGRKWCESEVVIERGPRRATVIELFEEGEE